MRTGESNEPGPRDGAAAQLMNLAKWIDDQLGATSISRQVIAEQAAGRIRELAEWLRGAARPGDDPAAEELRLPCESAGAFTAPTGAEKTAEGTW